MGQFLLKPEKDEDFYILWSTVVDMPLAWGPKADFQENKPFEGDYPDSRFDRADKYTSSALFYKGSWEAEDDRFNYGMYGWLQRWELKLLTDKLEELSSSEEQDIVEVPEDHPEILGLLHEFPEDD